MKYRPHVNSPMWQGVLKLWMCHLGTLWAMICAAVSSQHQLAEGAWRQGPLLLCQGATWIMKNQSHSSTFAFSSFCNLYSLFPFALQYPKMAYSLNLLVDEVFRSVRSVLWQIESVPGDPAGFAADLPNSAIHHSLQWSSRPVEQGSPLQTHGPSDFTAHFLIFKQRNYFNCVQVTQQNSS